MLKYIKTPEGFIVGLNNDIWNEAVLVTAKTAEEINTENVNSFFQLFTPEEWGKKVREFGIKKNLEENIELFSIYSKFKEVYFEYIDKDDKIQEEWSEENWLIEKAHHQMGFKK